jgi:hypothetical protein
MERSGMSRSKEERIKIKMELAPVRRSRGQKEYLWAQIRDEWGYTLALQKYTPVYRARGVLTVYIFFF